MNKAVTGNSNRSFRPRETMIVATSGDSGHWIYTYSPHEDRSAKVPKPGLSLGDCA